MRKEGFVLHERTVLLDLVRSVGVPVEVLVIEEEVVATFALGVVPNEDALGRREERDRCVVGRPRAVLLVREMRLVDVDEHRHAVVASVVPVAVVRRRLREERVRHAVEVDVLERGVRPAVAERIGQDGDALVGILRDEIADLIHVDVERRRREIGRDALVQADELPRRVDERPAAVAVRDRAVGLDGETLRLGREEVGELLLVLVAALRVGLHLHLAEGRVGRRALEAGETARVLLPLADARDAAGLRSPEEADPCVADGHDLLGDLRRALRDLHDLQLLRRVLYFDDGEIADGVDLHHDRAVHLVLALHAPGRREIAEHDVHGDDEILLSTLGDDVVVRQDVPLRIDDDARPERAVALHEHDGRGDLAVGVRRRHLRRAGRAGRRRVGALRWFGPLRRRGCVLDVTEQGRELLAPRANVRRDVLVHLRGLRRSRGLRGGARGRHRDLLRPRSTTERPHRQRESGDPET